MYTDFKRVFDEAQGLPDKYRTDEKCEKLCRHLSELLERGREFNLTAITDHDEAVRLHTVDSLFAAKEIGELSGGREATLIDIGSGGGFPALPIAIAEDSVSVTALDSTAKKCDFIKKAAALCGVRVETVPERAEEAVINLRESFDFATARAVARLNILVELAAPFVKVGGCFVAMKGRAAKEEIEEASRGAKTLGLTLDHVTPYTVEGGGERFIAVYRKTAVTPSAYPRRYAQIKKKPL